MSDCTCNRRIRLAEAGPSRREFLARCGLGVGSLGLASLLTEEVLAAAFAGGQARATHFPAKASHVIHIFAAGAPSQVDTWDPKPALKQRQGQPLPGMSGVAMASPFSFAKYGQSGIEVSEVFPAIAKHVDELALIRSMQTDVPAHDIAQLFMNTGSLRSVRPSIGA